MSTTSYEYTVVDAFTSKIFAGGAAAVIVFNKGEEPDDRKLQLIAREFNVSETAFVTHMGMDNNQHIFGLRWFAPKVEMALCGHGTLATAHVLSTKLRQISKNLGAVQFTTKSGKLTARYLLDGRIELELPAGLAREVGSTLNLKRRVTDAVKAAMGFTPKVSFVGIGEGVSFGQYILIDIAGPFDLENAAINVGPFLSLAPEHCAVIISTTSSVPTTSFESRVFMPAVGVDEDPACGSAHCMLGPYWHQKLKLKDGDTMHARQVSERGANIEVVWDRQRGKCRLIGEAITVMKGVLTLPA